MSGFQPPEPNVILKPTADIALVQEKNGIVQKESYPVIPKINMQNDFVRPVLMSDLKKMKEEAEKLDKGKVQWDEIGIGLATMGFGATLSAIASNVQLNTGWGKFFYILIPIISFSISVFVIMFKILKAQTSKYSTFQINQIIMQYIDSEKEEKS